MLGAGKEAVVVRIRITGWNEEAAWASYHPADLEQRLLRLRAGSRKEVKDLAGRVWDREYVTLSLPGAPDRFAAESLRFFLESLGASVEVEDA
jgi:hypothetical protein